MEVETFNATLKVSVEILRRIVTDAPGDPSDEMLAGGADELFRDLDEYEAGHAAG
jgi:hypothetical protein